MSERRTLLLLIPAVALLGFHARTLDYGFVWTDGVEIVGEALILPLESVHRAFLRPMAGDSASSARWAYYRPLQIVALSAIHHLAGETPRAYRLVSLLMGALTASTFMALVWLLIGRPGPALFAALMPALHPAGLEVYVWIAGLSESMADLLLVASFGCAVLWLRDPPVARPRAVLGASLGFFALALFTKENAAILPGLVLALVVGDALAARGARATPRERTWRFAGFAFSRRGLLLAGGLGLAALAHLAVLRPLALGGASLAVTPIDGDPVHHVLTAFSTWPGSLLWLVLPLQSTTSDVVEIVRSPSNPLAWLGLALPAASFAVWALLAGRGRRAAALGLAWIWIAFLPTSNLLPTLHAKADRHLFFSTFGLALVLADLGPDLLARLRAPKRAAVAAAVALLAFYGQRSWTRAPDWRSTVTLFERDVGREPDFREGRYWLAAALIQERRYAEAIEHLERLLPQTGGVPGKASYLRGDPYGFYCHAQLQLGHVDRAVQFVRKLERDLPRRAASTDVKRCLREALER